jgi:hypothetical protein
MTSETVRKLGTVVHSAREAGVAKLLVLEFGNSLGNRVRPWLKKEREGRKEGIVEDV